MKGEDVSRCKDKVIGNVLMNGFLPDKCRCGKVGQGSRNSDHCYRHVGYKCSCHRLNNRSLKNETEYSVC